jgi:hypothetical protein
MHVCWKGLVVHTRLMPARMHGQRGVGLSMLLTAIVVTYIVTVVLAIIVYLQGLKPESADQIL